MAKKLNVAPENPILARLAPLDVGRFVDFNSEADKDSNLIGTKIAYWVKKKKLNGKFSRRRINEKTIRVFRVA